MIPFSFTSDDEVDRCDIFSFFFLDGSIEIQLLYEKWHVFNVCNLMSLHLCIKPLKSWPRFWLQTCPPPLKVSWWLSAVCWVLFCLVVVVVVVRKFNMRSTPLTNLLSAQNSIANYRHYTIKQISQLMHLASLKLYIFWPTASLFPSLQPLAITTILSASVNLTILDISFKSICGAFALLRLAYPI